LEEVAGWKTTGGFAGERRKGGEYQDLLPTERREQGEKL